MKTSRRIIFRDAQGRYVKASDRYTAKTTKVQAMRRGQLITLIQGEVTPEKLATVTTRKEFESMPAAFTEVRAFKTKVKDTQAWDYAKQIDKTKKIRRKLLRITMDVRDGKRLRRISTYTKINKNSESSYRIYRQMNDALSKEGYFTYNRDPRTGQVFTDRKGGRKVNIEAVHVETVL